MLTDNVSWSFEMFLSFVQRRDDDDGDDDGSESTQE